MSGEAGEDVVALGHQVDPPLRRGIAEERGDQPALGRVEGGGADQPLAVDVDAEPGGGLDALDDRGPAVRSGGRGGARRCGSSPRSRWTSSQRPSFDSDTSGHASLSGRSVKHGVSSAARVAEAVPPHRAVVAGLLVADLGGVGVARVGEAGARRAATPPTRRGCGGARRGAASPARTSRIRSVDRSSPPVEVPNATREPSGDGSYQSMAEVTSPGRVGGVDERPDRGR